MSTVAAFATASAVRDQRGGSAPASGWRHLFEPAALFALSWAILFALGLRSTTQLHLVYPDAITRLDNAFLAWWNHPPGFREIGFTYPPLQGVALLPLALLRPLATSLVALPLFSALCGATVIAVLDRTLAVIGVVRGLRVLLLVLFLANPLFLDYGSNGSATCLVMALLAAGLHNFCAWYMRGASSMHSLAWSGLWFAIAFLARYEVALWVVLVAVAVAVVRFRRGARPIEVFAHEAILLAPLIYVFLIWCGVSSLVGGAGALSWITRSGAEHINGLTYGGRAGFLHRSGGIASVMWQASPLMLIAPAVAVLVAFLSRRWILLVIAAAVIIGGAVGALRMLVLPNPQLLQPAYVVVAFVPMLIATGWLLSLAAGLQRRPIRRGASAIGTLIAVVALAAALPTAYDLMHDGTNVYDRQFTGVLSSYLDNLGPTRSSQAQAAARVYEDQHALATFLEAVAPTADSVLLDEQAFPGVILTQDDTKPYRTRVDNGDPEWELVLGHPLNHGIHYLVVANPKVAIPGYPRDRISQRYPQAYSGGLRGTHVIYRNPLFAVVQVVSGLD